MASKINEMLDLREGVRSDIQFRTGVEGLGPGGMVVVRLSAEGHAGGICGGVHLVLA